MVAERFNSPFAMMEVGHSQLKRFNWLIVCQFRWSNMQVAAIDQFWTSIVRTAFGDPGKWSESIFNTRWNDRFGWHEEQDLLALVINADPEGAFQALVRDSYGDAPMSQTLQEFLVPQDHTFAPFDDAQKNCCPTKGTMKCCVFRIPTKETMNES